ncbi:brca2 and cdkn1a interacting protein [Anaeramoeba ignava]|uniref:Brca2 and cdkn1a interacting protein n=1 Tax=Anaeramoeba ignava TaxID=1746090 RepID=A0A9Q0L9E0_ANAIG|nr:brca2 and cdkn1a interacting protein [Anaeramoeba ignava]
MSKKRKNKMKFEIENISKQNSNSDLQTNLPEDSNINTKIEIDTDSDTDSDSFNEDEMVHRIEMFSLEDEKEKGKEKEKEKEKGKELNSDESDGENEDILVDFEFFDPKPEDETQIIPFFQNWIDIKNLDLDGIIQFILHQTRVGTVIKNGENGDIFGFISVINISKYKMNSVEKIIESIIEKSQKTPKKNFMKMLFANPKKQIGLIVSNRIINLPLELAPPLTRGLFDEISWATEDEPTEELRNSFKFTDYIYVTRAFREFEMEKNSVKKSRKTKNLSKSELYYTKFEDEFYLKASQFHFMWPIPPKEENPITHYYQVVMVIPQNKLPSIRKQVHEALGMEEEEENKN